MLAEASSRLEHVAETVRKFPGSSGIKHVRLLLSGFESAMLKCGGGKLMSEVKTFNPAADEPADYKAAVTEYIERIDRIRQQMVEDQKEIDRLKGETREILARLEAA